MGESQSVSIGRSVHLVDFSGTHRAAIVTHVHPEGVGAVVEAVDLAVFGTRGIAFFDNIPKGLDTEMRGTWHWPERV